MSFLFKKFFCFILVSVFFLWDCSSKKGEKQLIFWAMGAEGENVKALIPEFEKENPDIKIDVQSIPWGAAHEKLLTGFAGGATPDVCQLGNTWLPEFSALEALYSLDSLINNSSVVKPDSFFSGVWKTNVINGKTLGVPWYVDTRVLFYRKDILQKAGYDHPPDTWEEWLDASRKIKKLLKNDNRYALYFSLIFNDGYVPVMLIMENNGRFLKDNNSRAAFDDPKTREAFEYYLTYFREGLASKSFTEFTNIYQGFEDGDFTMMVHGPWVANEIKKRSKSFSDKWATSVMPRKETRSSWAGGASLVMFRNCRNPKVAWKLIEYLSRPKTQENFFKVTNDLPSRREPWNTPQLRDDAKIHAFYEQLDDVGSVPLIPEWERIYVAIQQNLENAIFGKQTLDEMIVSLNTEVDKILEKRRWLLSQRLLKK